MAKNALKSSPKNGQNLWNCLPGVAYLVGGHHAAHGDLLDVAVVVVELHQLQHLLPLRPTRQQLVVTADLVDDEDGDVLEHKKGMSVINKMEDHQILFRFNQCLVNLQH